MRHPGASRLVLIGIAVVLMAATVYVVGSSIQAGQREARLMPARAEPTPEIPFEAGVFRRAEKVLDYAAMPEAPPSKRTLALYDSRRAFPGAPPVIPHPIGDTGHRDGGCLACHTDGGWVPRFGAYAPVVPHPELTSCRECHVPQETRSVFRATTWERGAAPAVSRAALPGSPPPIPTVSRCGRTAGRATPGQGPSWRSAPRILNG